MGQTDSRHSTVTSSFDPQQVEQSKNDLLYLFGMNQQVFGELCENTEKLTKEMKLMKSSFSAHIKPFFTKDAVVS